MDELTQKRRSTTERFNLVHDPQEVCYRLVLGMKALCELELHATARAIRVVPFDVWVRWPLWFLAGVPERTH